MLKKRERSAPERRTRLDLTICAVIAVVAVVIGVVVWQVSDERHSHSHPADAALTIPMAAASAPAVLSPAWSVPSPATSSPALGGAVFVTGNGGTVSGIDPVTGDTRWSYDRDHELCAVTVTGNDTSALAVAAYRNSRGCGEVSTIKALTGTRGPTRSSDDDTSITLSSDGDYTLAQGPTRLETWGNTMIRGVEYGRVDAPVNPDVQPRSGCTLLSSGVGSGRVAVVERCPGDVGYRLTVIATTLDSNQKVQQYGSQIVTASTDTPAPRVVGVGTNAVALYDGSPTGVNVDGPVIRLYSFEVTLMSTHRVSGAAAAPADSVPVTSEGLTCFWTGTDTVVLDANSLVPTYQVPGTLGPGSMMGSDLVMPEPGVLAVLDPATGAKVRAIAVDRGAHTSGAVSVGVIGDVVAELYDHTLHGLRSRTP
ncbi:hypothetical protein GCM10027169_15440 [Gordonia jinhuaensis]|uniref:PQQ-like domain-containing protein n=1 Tax=Gordonia jinhuaensis TaxID=1517702 RepID=A0A916T7M7_9ACTN|nr:PQQ-binding-like beta-propeller repeat protein [Gordonia jinhuaensis]GGB34699.1 hypothetical protein GCM10011489_23480 [Gordonia jinhuaensis]